MEPGVSKHCVICSRCVLIGHTVDRDEFRRKLVIFGEYSDYDANDLPPVCDPKEIPFCARCETTLDSIVKNHDALRAISADLQKNVNVTKLQKKALRDAFGDSMETGGGKPESVHMEFRELVLKGYRRKLNAEKEKHKRITVVRKVIDGKETLLDEPMPPEPEVDGQDDNRGFHSGSGYQAPPDAGESTNQISADDGLEGGNSTATELPLVSDGLRSTLLQPERVCSAKSNEEMEANPTTPMEVPYDHMKAVPGHSGTCLKKQYQAISYHNYDDSSDDEYGDPLALERQVTHGKRTSDGVGTPSIILNMDTTTLPKRLRTSILAIPESNSREDREEVKEERNCQTLPPESQVDTQEASGSSHSGGGSASEVPPDASGSANRSFNRIPSGSNGLRSSTSQQSANPEGVSTENSSDKQIQLGGNSTIVTVSQDDTSEHMISVAGPSDQNRRNGRGGQSLVEEGDPPLPKLRVRLGNRPGNAAKPPSTLVPDAKSGSRPKRLGILQRAIIESDRYDDDGTGADDNAEEEEEDDDPDSNDPLYVPTPESQRGASASRKKGPRILGLPKSHSSSSAAGFIQPVRNKPNRRRRFFCDVQGCFMSFISTSTLRSHKVRVHNFVQYDRPGSPANDDHGRRKIYNCPVPGCDKFYFCFNHLKYNHMPIKHPKVPFELKRN